MNGIRAYVNNTPGWVQVLVAAFLFGLGLLTFYFFGQTDTLHCTRSSQSVDCTRTTTFMKIARLAEQSVQSLQSAKLDESCDSDGCTYRVVINSANGQAPLSIVYTSDQASQQRLANQINAFLADASRATFEVENSPGWLIIIPLALIFLGVAASAANFISRVSYDGS